jgi:hypothetical protein
MAFESLDFVYMPSRDPVADMAYFADVLGGRIVFAVEGMGARVAMVELSSEGPRILLADHVEGDAPILVYRVPDLDAALKGLKKHGWKRERTFEIPHGPVCSFRAPGGQRIALYRADPPRRRAPLRGSPRLLSLSGAGR